MMMVPYHPGLIGKRMENINVLVKILKALN